MINIIFIPDDFDVMKFIHLVEREMNSLIGKGMFDVIQEVEFDIVEGVSMLVKYGILHSNHETFVPILRILTNLELYISSELSPPGMIGSYMINVNHIKITTNVKRIASGGWGLKHGGWGHESKR